MDLDERKWKDADWIDFDKVRQKCRDFVEKVTEILVLWYKINISADWENIGFLIRTLLYRISWLVRCLVSIFLWLHYFISCDCITLFLVTASLYFLWLHYFISCDCITLFLVTAVLYFLWLQYFISCDYITLFLVTALLYFLWLQYFISCDCSTLFLVTAVLYFSWLHYSISCECSILFLVTVLLYFLWLHYFISCMQPYDVIAVTSSVITFNYIVNLKIVCPSISASIVNVYGKDDRLLIPRKCSKFYLLHHVCSASVSSLSHLSQYIQIILSLGLRLHPVPKLRICDSVSPLLHLS
jgi:hypothetical protein